MTSKQEIYGYWYTKWRLVEIVAQNTGPVKIDRLLVHEICRGVAGSPDYSRIERGVRGGGAMAPSPGAQVVIRLSGFVAS